jgi:DNA repair protein RadC
MVPAVRKAAPTVPAAPRATPPKPAAHKRARGKRDMPRERLLDFGPGAVTDAERVALVPGSGLPGRTTCPASPTLR